MKTWPQFVSSVIINELKGILKEYKTTIKNIFITEERKEAFSTILSLHYSNKINRTQMKSLIRDFIFLCDHFNKLYKEKYEN